MIEPYIKRFIDKIKILDEKTPEQIENRVEFFDEFNCLFNVVEHWVPIAFFVDEFGSWMRSTLFPVSKINALKQQLPDFDLGRLPSLAYWQCGYGNSDCYIEPFFSKDGETFETAEIKLFFERHYHGRPRGDESYIEFSQLVTHLFDLHYVSAKSAYCVIDEAGDEVGKIRIIKNQNVTLILFDDNLLSELLDLGKWVLVRYFEFKVKNNEEVRSLGEPREEPGFYCSDNIKYKIITFSEGEQTNYLEYRGACILSSEDIKNNLGAEAGKKPEYASFIVQDMKNQKILNEYSLHPKNFANYYTESDLPWETSPIFFRAEVLDKYKNDPDKYILEERAIQCRGGWYLQSYDVNDFNQVHTYAVYLRNLPYQEQLYWKSFNERPKSGLSERAWKTDFEGEYFSSSPLDRLKKALEHLGSIKIDNKPIWMPKGGSWENAAKGLFYVNNENANEWHNFILCLSNVITEGLQQSVLKKIAAKYGYDKDNINHIELRSLGLINFILQKSKNEAYLQTTYEVLKDLQKTRGEGKAHGTWKRPEGSLIEDAKQRLEQVIRAIESLVEIFQKLLSN